MILVDHYTLLLKYLSNQLHKLVRSKATKYWMTSFIKNNRVLHRLGGRVLRHFDDVISSVRQFNDVISSVRQFNDVISSVRQVNDVISSVRQHAKRMTFVASLTDAFWFYSDLCWDQEHKKDWDEEDPMQGT